MRRDPRQTNRNTRRTWLRYAVASLLPLSLTACPGSLTNPELFAVDSGGSSSGGSGSGTDGSSACNAPVVLEMNCGFDGCHGGGTPAGGLDLSSAGQGSLSTHPSMDYPGENVVAPGDITKSALYAKLLPNAKGMNGQMPNSVGLNAPDIACIASWITAYVPGSGGSSGAGGSSSSGGSSSGAGSSSSSGGSSSGAGSSSSSGAGSSSSGGSSSGGGDGGAAITFTQVYSTIIMPSCLPCHSTGAGKTTGKLDMSTKATAFTNLVGVAGAGSGCLTKGTRVVAGKSATSLLYEKLQPTVPCGNRMPRPATGTTVTPLSTTQINDIAMWIDNGALNN